MWLKSASIITTYYIASICRNIAMNIIAQQINVIGSYIYKTYLFKQSSNSLTHLPHYVGLFSLQIFSVYTQTNISLRSVATSY